jgi:hypothetical protein
MNNKLVALGGLIGVWFGIGATLTYQEYTNPPSHLGTANLQLPREWRAVVTKTPDRKQNFKDVTNGILTEILLKYQLSDMRDPDANTGVELTGKIKIISLDTADRNKSPYKLQSGTMEIIPEGP